MSCTNIQASLGFIRLWSSSRLISIFFLFMLPMLIWSFSNFQEMFRLEDILIHRPFRERLLKAFSNTHAFRVFESKSRLEQIKFVHAIKSTKNFLLYPRSKFEQESKTTSFEWMFSWALVRMVEASRHFGKSFEVKPQEWSFCVWFAVSNNDKDIYWFGVMVEDVSKLDDLRWKFARHNEWLETTVFCFCSLIETNQLVTDCCKFVAHCYQIQHLIENYNLSSLAQWQT